MQRYFFSHLVSIQSIHLKLQDLDLEDEEKSELVNLANDTLHYEIINKVLSELSREDKKIFLRQMTMNDHPGIWRFLNKKIDKIEEKIQKMTDDVVSQLHKDIEESKKLSAKK
ncbi:MAG: hypothetical protein Q8Q49_03680 [bacterium]|nr:hypothetical protein [bacterium]